LRRAARQLVDDLLQYEQAFIASNVVPPEVDIALKDFGPLRALRISRGPFGGLALGMVPHRGYCKRAWPPSSPVSGAFLRVALGASSKTIVNHGSQAQEGSLASKNCQRNLWALAFVLTEAGAGSDLSSLRLSAKADRRWLRFSTGQRTYISNADVADLYVVFARTGGSDELRNAFFGLFD